HTRSKRDWSSDVCSSDLVIEIIGNTSTTLSTCFLNNDPTPKPSNTGINTTCKIDTIIAENEMSNQVEASSSVKLGVTIGASNVVTVVAATLNATLPFAKNVITLLEVPPGLDPTKITPIAISGGKLNKNTSDTAMIGITKY